MKQLIYTLVFITAGLLLASCATHETPAKPQTVPVPTTVNLAQAAKINVNLGLRYLQEGQRARAKEKLLLAQSQQESANTNMALAYFYEQTGELAQAEQYYQKAIALNPQAGAPHNNYGAFLCREKRYQEADAQFNLAVQDPKYLNTAKAYENAGICALMIPDPAKAKIDFTKALQHDPSLPTAREELAKLNASVPKSTESTS